MRVEKISRIDLEVITQRNRWDNCEILVVDLPDVLLKNKLEFTNCVFQGLVNFEGSILKEEIIFINCKFLDFAAFRGASFPSHIRFQKCNFEKGATFASGSSNAPGHEGEQEDIFHFQLTECVVDGYLTFNNRSFLRSSDFRNSIFRQPPHFQNTSVHQGVKFEGATFLLLKNLSELDYERSMRAFRRLKQISRDLGDNSLYGQFSALELKSRLNLKSTQLFEKFLIRTYGLLSNFGQSIIRPCATLALIPILSTIALTAILKTGVHELPDLLTFSVSQQTSPFSVFSPNFARTDQLNPYFEMNTFTLRGVGLIVSILTFTSVGLFIAALRRRFTPV
jgi:hypothetical protein